MKQKLVAIRDAVSNPMGTARLLEGFSTLRRADEAGISPAQMRVLFPDLAACTDADVRGFINIGTMLTRGDLRLQGRAFDGARHPATA